MRFVNRVTLLSSTLGGIPRAPTFSKSVLRFRAWVGNRAVLGDDLPAAARCREFGGRRLLMPTNSRELGCEPPWNAYTCPRGGRLAPANAHEFSRMGPLTPTDAREMGEQHPLMSTTSPELAHECTPMRADCLDLMPNPVFATQGIERQLAKSQRRHHLSCV